MFWDTEARFTLSQFSSLCCIQSFDASNMMEARPSNRRAGLFFFPIFPPFLKDFCSFAGKWHHAQHLGTITFRTGCSPIGRSKTSPLSTAPKLLFLIRCNGGRRQPCTLLSSCTTVAHTLWMGALPPPCSWCRKSHSIQLYTWSLWIDLIYAFRYFILIFTLNTHSAFQMLNNSHYYPTDQTVCSKHE